MGNAESSSKVPAKSIITEQKVRTNDTNSTKNVNTQSKHVINNSKKSQPVQNKNIYSHKSAYETQVYETDKTELSFEVSGKIDLVNINLGDNIKAGQILATLDNSSYILNLKQSQGKVKEADARLIEAQNIFDRQLKLHKEGWTTKAALDNAQAALDTAKSAVDVAKAQYDIADKNLNDTSLFAPYDGKITSRLIEPSQAIEAGQPVFLIEGNKGFEVKAKVPETIIRYVNRGNIYKTYFSALPNIHLDGKITEVGSRAESANAFPVILRLEDSHPSLRAGMTVEIDFTFMGHGRTGYVGDAVKVPLSSILAGDQQNAYVFIYDEDKSVVTKRKIQTENIFNNENISTIIFFYTFYW